MLRANDIPELASFLQRDRLTYTSHDIQNEILELMAHSVLRSVVADISNAGMYSLIVDETTDQSTTEQVSICMRYVDETALQPNEVFLGLYESASTTGELLCDVIQDALTRFALPVDTIRGQCCDGASSMSGQFKGVRARMQVLQPKDLYAHCFAHSLNLCIQDAVRCVPLYRDVMQYLHDLSTIVRGSAKRMLAFVDIARAVVDGSPTLPQPLCPTRWAVRYAAIDATLKSYAVVIDFLHEVAEMATADNSATKARGLARHFESGDAYLAHCKEKRIYKRF